MEIYICTENIDRANVDYTFEIVSSATATAVTKLSLTWMRIHLAVNNIAIIKHFIDQIAEPITQVQVIVRSCGIEAYDVLHLFVMFLEERGKTEKLIFTSCG